MQPLPASLPEYLEKNQFTQKDLDAIQSGKPIAKLLEVGQFHASVSSRGNVLEKSSRDSRDRFGGFA
jgi:hypothetical protein